MGRYIARRLVQAIPMLLLLSMGLFLLVNVAPGDPVAAMSGQRPRPQVRERLRRQLGLDQPLPIQYLAFSTELV